MTSMRQLLIERDRKLAERDRWERYVNVLQRYQDAHDAMKAANDAGDREALREAVLRVLAVDVDELVRAWRATEESAPGRTPWEELRGNLEELRAFAVESGWLPLGEAGQWRVIDGRVRGRVLRELT